MKEHVGHNHDTVKKMSIKPRKEIKDVTAPLERIVVDLSEIHDNFDRVEKSIRAKVLMWKTRLTYITTNCFAS